MTFAEAANKYLGRPGQRGGGRGRPRLFSLNSGFIEEFADAAFKLKKGSISDPVETPYGYHLIQVTDRKEGPPVDFEQNKPLIMQALRRASSRRDPADGAAKTAKIDIKPMPKDLFPPAPASAGPGDAAAGGARGRHPRAAARQGDPRPVTGCSDLIRPGGSDPADDAGPGRSTALIPGRTGRAGPRR